MFLWRLVSSATGATWSIWLLTILVYLICRKGGVLRGKSEGHHWRRSNGDTVDQHGALLGLFHEVTQ